MKISIVKETRNGERRVSLTPDMAAKLIAQGAQVWLEDGAGEQAGFSNQAYHAKGVRIAPDKHSLYAEADLACWFKLPADPTGEIALLPTGATVIGFLDPFSPGEHHHGFHSRSITALSLELLPQNPQTQSKDAFAAMGRLAGEIAYRNAATTTAEEHGREHCATVLVIGSGNTAQAAMLGAFQDGHRLLVAATNSACRQWVESELAGHFIELPVTEKHRGNCVLARQQRILQRVIKEWAPDMIITTARRYGKQAPLLLPEDSLDLLPERAVIEDLAASIGGNTAATRLDQSVERANGVLVRNRSNYPSQVPREASLLYSECLGQILCSLLENQETDVLERIEDDPHLREAVLSADRLSA